MTSRLLSPVAVLLLAAPATAFAQSRATTADLSGVVLDQSRAVLAGTKITVVNVDTLLARTATTEPNGRFALPVLAVGTYRVRAEHAGFSPLVMEDVRLTVGGLVDLELQLDVAAIEERVSVVASASAATTEKTPVSTVIQHSTIDALPTNGRNFIAFSTITPGVSTDQTPQQGASRTSGLTFAGQRGRSNNIMVDGLDNNDETVGSVRATFSQEAVREFQVITNSAPAEFGNASGGVVNIVTKSGTNAMSGNGFGFFRDKRLNSKGYFERFSPSGQPIDQPKASFSQQQFGGTLGGPIRRNSSFFFLSYERLNSDASNFVTIDDQTIINNPLNPTAILGTPAQILRVAGFPVKTGNVPYLVRSNQFLGRIDVARPANSISVRFNTATELNENIEPFGGQVALSRAAALESTDVMTGMSDTLVLSDRTVNEVRGQVALRNQTVRSLDPNCGGECLNESQGGPTLEVIGVASVGRQRFTPSLRNNTRYEILDTLSHYRGSHQFRAGFDVSYLQGRDQSLPLHFGGRYIFQDAALPLVPGLPPIPFTAIQEVALGLPLAYVQGYGDSGAGYNDSDLSVFVQDAWRIRHDVTLNIGLRYQRQFWPSASYHPAGYPGTYDFPSDKNNLAPRVAVAWNPLNDRKTSVHAAYGRYYDNLITSVYGITRYINGTDGVRTLVLRAPGSFTAWTAPGHRLSEDAAMQIVGGQYPSVAITIDPSLKTPYAHHVNAGIDRQLPEGVSVAMNFLYVRGFNQLGTIDYNPIVPQLGPGRRPADVNGVAGTSASVLQYTSFGQTWYRGLTLSIEKQSSVRAGFLISYTLSKAEDNSTDFQSAFLPEDNGRGRNPLDPNGLPIGFDPNSERGSAVQDQRHRLVVSGTYTIRGGLQVAGVATVGSGRPYNILAGADLNGDGDGGSPSPDRARRNPSEPTSSVRRNSGVLPAQATVDIRMTRRFRVGERASVDPIFEVFNLFNRTNFTNLQNIFGTGAYPSNPIATFGQFTQASAPRQVQLALKVSF